MINGIDWNGWDPDIDWDDLQPITFGHLIELPCYQDDRGMLIVDSQECIVQECLQIYHSTTLPSKARDMDTWHVHHKQVDRFVALFGTAMFALSDGKTVERVVLCGETPQKLLVPPGIYHCFRVMGDMPFELLNFPNQLYNPKDEGRVPFYKLEVEHPW